MPGDGMQRCADFMRHGRHQLPDRGQPFGPVELILGIDQQRVRAQQTLRLLS